MSDESPRPYTSNEDLVADMSTDAYRAGDPVAHARVDARLAAAPAAAPAPPPVAPYSGRAELMAAKSDPRWDADPLYRQETLQRIAATSEAQVSSVSENRAQRLQLVGSQFVDTDAAQEARLQTQQEVEIQRRLPVHVEGVGEVTPFASIEEMVQAMNSRDYELDESFRALTELRLRVSDIL